MFVEEKTQGEVAEAPVRIKKLSEAIRAGAKLRPQARGFYFASGASCALGAAYEAITGKYHEAGEDWDGPDMSRWFTNTFGLSSLLGTQVTEKNDAGKTRESIADELESQGF